MATIKLGSKPAPRKKAKINDDEGDYKFEDDDEDDFNFDLEEGAHRHVDFARNIFTQDDMQPELVIDTKAAERAKHFVPFDPNKDVTQQRPGYQIVDNVSYYNILSMCILLYAHITEGIPIPAVFNAETQSL